MEIEYESDGEGVAIQTLDEFRDHWLYTGNFLKQMVLPDEDSTNGEANATLDRAFTVLMIAGKSVDG